MSASEHTAGQYDYTLTREELQAVCVYHPDKEFGALTMRDQEPTPAVGWGEDAAGDDVLVTIGGQDYNILHMNRITSPAQVRHDLMLAATYIALQPQLRTREAVVGVTYMPLVRLAARRAGFTVLRTSLVEPTYNERLRHAYDATQISKKEPYSVGMAYMPTQHFIDRFASKRVGTDAAAIAATIFSPDVNY